VQHETLPLADHPHNLEAFDCRGRRRQRLEIALTFLPSKLQPFLLADRLDAEVGRFRQF